MLLSAIVAAWAVAEKVGAGCAVAAMDRVGDTDADVACDDAASAVGEGVAEVAAVEAVSGLLMLLMATVFSHIIGHQGDD